MNQTITQLLSVSVLDLGPPGWGLHCIDGVLQRVPLGSGLIPSRRGPGWEKAEFCRQSWASSKCQLSLQLCDSLPIVSCFGVLWAGISVSVSPQSHSLTPGPAHGGEELFLHSKTWIPGDSGAWVVDATSAQELAAALLGLLRGFRVCGRRGMD